MDNISIVLVAPQGPLNVGSVCRAMMNFGCSNLRLVTPCPEYRSLDARRMALKAVSILNQASVYPTLQQALADCHLAFGTTRRFGKYREDCITPKQSAAHALSQSSDSRVAFVFGREDRGLHTSELDLCQFFVTIPTDSAYPSMNLSHAVTLILYELRQMAMDAEPFSDNSQIPAPAKDVENMFQHMRRTLLAADYLDPKTRTMSCGRFGGCSAVPVSMTGRCASFRGYGAALTGSRGNGKSCQEESKGFTRHASLKATTTRPTTILIMKKKLSLLRMASARVPPVRLTSE
jgi:tRNA/rRNA methyltransferase